MAIGATCWPSAPAGTSGLRARACPPDLSRWDMGPLLSTPRPCVCSQEAWPRVVRGLPSSLGRRNENTQTGGGRMETERGPSWWQSPDLSVPPPSNQLRHRELGWLQREAGGQGGAQGSGSRCHVEASGRGSGCFVHLGVEGSLGGQRRNRQTSGPVPGGQPGLGPVLRPRGRTHGRSFGSDCGQSHAWGSGVRWVWALGRQNREGMERLQPVPATSRVSGNVPRPGLVSA